MLKDFTGSGREQRIMTVSTMLRNIGCNDGTHLLETDGSSLLAEALAAEVKAVLADETGLVGAEAAVGSRGSVRVSRFPKLSASQKRSLSLPLDCCVLYNAG